MFTNILIFVPLGTIFTLLSSTTAIVRLESQKLNYANESYIGPDTKIGDIVKVNETYNKLPLHYEIIQDFPLDTVLETEVQMFDEQNNSTLLGYYYVNICNMSDPLYQYLPPFLLELTADGECVKKGTYDFDDSGQFQFYNLEPEEKYENAVSFIAYNKIVASDILIKNIDLTSDNV